MTDTVPCTSCNGTGRVPVDQCADHTARGRCQRPSTNDPAYFELHPDRARWRMYCMRHLNLRVRHALQRERHAHD